MGRPRQEAARDTRGAILRTALDLFAERGYHASGMRTLAATVGVRESALYHHFPSKAALLDAVVADFAARSRAALEADPGDLLDRPLEEILTLLTQRALAQFSSPPYRKLLRLMITAGLPGLADGEPLWRRATDESRRSLGRLISRLRRAGKVRDDLDVEVVRLHLTAALAFAVNLFLGEGDKGAITMPLGRFVRQHVAFMAQALAPPRPRARRRS
jgi:AcrR family transcriptional regulator